MQFEFPNVHSAQGAQVQVVRSTLEIFASDPTLSCLMFRRYHNGRVEFLRNIRGNMPIRRPIASVVVMFSGSSYETVSTLEVVLIDGRKCSIVRTPLHEAGNSHINSYELEKFVQALHAKWQREQ